MKPDEMTIPCSLCGLNKIIKKSAYKTQRSWGKKKWYHRECNVRRNGEISIGGKMAKIDSKNEYAS